MTKAEGHYRDRIAALTSEITSLRKSISVLVAARLTAFLIFGFGIWGLIKWESNLHWGLITAAGLIVFMISLKKHGRKKVTLDVARRSKQIVETESKSLSSRFLFGFEGKEYQHVDHDFTHDLDLFGPRSMFQAICRAGLKSSRKRLAAQLSRADANREEVLSRQKAIAELVEHPVLREEIQALTSLASEAELDESKLIQWCKSKLSGAPAKGLRILFFIVPALQVINVSLYSFDVIGESLFTLILLAPLAITLRRIAKTKNDYLEIDTQYKELSKLTAAIDKLTAEEWSSEPMIHAKEELLSGSKALSNLQLILGRFDDRNNFIVAILGNMFFAWDLWCSMSLHAWHDAHAEEVERSLEALFTFETFSSFAAYNFNFESQLVHPELSDKGGVNAVDLKHPLMNHDVCVANGLAIDESEIKIITGANMAGKSTFLRTVGLNFVLAMNGSKVCAESFSFMPTSLYTSMRTSDSLQDQESYFFNELKRLHVLVEKLQEGERPFILLDEILKGTNSKDKAEGSFKFVEKLLTFNATAIIATHDLSLCELGNLHPQRIENLFFDVEIKEDDLAFDYQIRKGVCSNMNATFLMRKMGITD